MVNVMKKVFNGLMIEAVKISESEFYKLGGFSNPDLFRNIKGHFKNQMTSDYKKFKSEKSK